jgi:hypothetical protein
MERKQIHLTAADRKGNHSDLPFVFGETVEHLQTLPDGRQTFKKRLFASTHDTATVANQPGWFYPASRRHKARTYPSSETGCPRS